MTAKMLRHLLWKDARSVRPLIIAAVLAIVGFYLLLFLYAKSSPEVFIEQITLAYVIWILIPNLFAFSLPAFLVGSEEESGSLDWLKTLPANWKAIALSKFLLAVGYTVAVWLISTAGLGLYFATVPEDVFRMATSTGDGVENWQILFLGQAAFTLSLLLVSMINAYIFRSPITALVMVLPALLALMIGYAQSVSVIVGSTQPPLEARDWLVLIGIYSTGIGALLLVKIWVARNRIVAPESNLRHRFAGTGETNNAYRPPHATVVSAGHFLRPGAGLALIWQQLRQTRWLLFAFTFCACAGTVLAHTFDQNGSQNGWIILTTNLAIISTVALPCLAFYGDSSRGRSQFFADRGISPTLVWLTRVAPPTACALLVLATFLFMQAYSARPAADVSYLIACAFMGYAVCQFVSQWVARPTLGFFAAPAALGMTGLTYAILFDAYPDWIPLLFVTAILLVFASWRLTFSWMSRPSTQTTDWRFLSYAVLVIVLPYVVVLGTRWATMPSADLAWRKQMESLEFPESARPPVAVRVQIPTYLRQSGYAVLRQRDESFLKIVEKELNDTEAIGAHLSTQDLLWNPWHTNSLTLPDGDDPLTEEERTAAALRSIRVLLKWANVIRDEAIAGRVGFGTLNQAGEQAQHNAVGGLMQLISREGLTEEIAELCDQVPDVKRVHQSRSAALIAEWQRGQIFSGPNFGAYKTEASSWNGFVERPRARRLMEKAIRLAIENWGAGNELSDQHYATLAEYFRDAGLNSNPIETLPQKDRDAEALRELARELRSTNALRPE
ncbi:MAG: ABC transporter permease [Planctomycetota bacterium]